MAPMRWPTSIASSTDLPSARAPRKPPANASPAPFVSTICADSSFWTAYVLGDSERPTADGVEHATMVDDSPWVMTTRRGVAVFFFGSSASLVAIVGMSLV